MKEILEEFIEWARECGEDVFYIFENTDEAIEKFMKEKETFKSEQNEKSGGGMVDTKG